MPLTRPRKPRNFTPDDVWIVDDSGRKHPPTLLEKMARREPEIYQQWRLYSNYPNHLTLINWFISTGRVYYNPGKPELINNHGAETILYAQDMHHRSNEYRTQKFREAMEFHGPVTQYKVLNAIRAISPGYDGSEFSGDIFASGAALIYLSSLAALHAPKDKRTGLTKTFLDTCIENGFGLGVEKSDKAQLKAALQKTFRDLNIAHLDEAKSFLKMWEEKGSFMADGFEQKSENGSSQGSYVILASNLYAHNTQTIGFNNLMSFVVTHSSGLALHKEKYILAADKFHQFVNNYDRNYSDLVIKFGQMLRIQEMESAAKDVFRDIKIKPISTAGREYFRKLFKNMSYETLAMIALCGHSVAYAAGQGNVESLYPGEKGTAVLGNDATTCDISRGSAGFRISNPKTIIFSDGYAGLDMTPENLLVRNAMTLMHEAIHIVLDHPMFIHYPAIGAGLMPHEYHDERSYFVGGVKQAIIEACEKLHAMDDNDKKQFLGWSTLLDPYLTLGDLFNLKVPKIYAYGSDEWIEELLCNWVAISSRGGQYGKGTVANNIFHSVGKDDQEPDAVNFARMVTKAVETLVSDLYAAAHCSAHPDLVIPGVKGKDHPGRE